MPTSLSNFFFAAAMTLVAGPSVFAQVTTFNVDMSCAPDFDNVFVTGPWCGWCANDVYNTMTDPDGDGIYSVTLDETVTGTIEYKYAINGFSDQENLQQGMIIRGIARRDFSLGFVVSTEYDVSKTNAIIKNGLLKISIPKGEVRKEKSINIRGE